MLNICQSRLPLLKDKGYAWVILALSFLSHFAHFGFSLGVLGNLTVAHQLHFGTSLENSTLIGAIHSSFLFGAAPIASVLVKKFGCRITEIVGGLCIILGLGFCSLATQTWHAHILFSVISGTGVACCYVASSEVLALHFDKYKNFAFAAANIGGFSGVVVWPIFSQYLLDSFGYSKAMGIMSAVQTIHIITGVLFFVPSLDSFELSPGVKSQESMPIDKTCFRQSTNISAPVGQQQVSGNNNTQGLPEGSELCEEKFNSDSGTSSPKEMSLMQNFTLLLTSWKAWCLLVCGLLRNMNTSSVYILVNDIMLNATGMTKSEVAVGITILGIANVVGSVLVSLGSSLRFNRMRLHIFSILLYGASTIVIAFSINKAMFYTTVAGFGLGQGIGISNLLSAITTICDLEQLTLLMGLEFLCESIGAIAGPALCGYLTSFIKPEYTMVFSGSFSILAACCLLPIIIQQLSQRNVQINIEVKEQDNKGFQEEVVPTDVSTSL